MLVMLVGSCFDINDTKMVGFFVMILPLKKMLSLPVTFSAMEIHPNNTKNILFKKMVQVIIKYKRNIKVLVE